MRVKQLKPTLQFYHREIRSVFRDKLCVRSSLDNLTMVENQYLVCFLDRLETVCYDDDGTTDKEAMEGFRYLLLGEAIERGGRFVQEYDFRIFQEYFCDSETLFLSSGEPHSPLSNLGFESFREFPYEFTMRERKYFFYLCFAALFSGGRYEIFTYGSVKYGRILCKVSDICKIGFACYGG